MSEGYEVPTELPGSTGLLCCSAAGDIEPIYVEDVEPLEDGRSKKKEPCVEDRFDKLLTAAWSERATAREYGTYLLCIYRQNKVNRNNVWNKYNSHGMVGKREQPNIYSLIIFFKKNTNKI